MAMSTFTRLGYRAAVVCGVAAVAYGVVSFLVAAFAPAALTWEGYEQFAADYRLWPTMAVLAPPFVVASGSGCASPGRLWAADAWNRIPVCPIAPRRWV